VIAGTIIFSEEMNCFEKWAVSALMIVILPASLFGQAVQAPFPVKRPESAQTWQRDGWNALDAAKRLRPRYGPAKDVILFIGDGMGVSTLTAARILEGQMPGESGLQNR